ncbi:MAG: ABC transporter substrate-binding protein [Opitutales bacterium]|jgi:ABC-type nitrate/sulfonate/bicarbonate transport system substrate-binding protein
MIHSKLRGLALAGIGALSIFSASFASAKEPLRIAYSDWPGWVAWEIGIKKGWFAEEGVEVQFLWFDYVASMDAYVAGQADAVTMTNGDALVTGATGKPSVSIIVDDYSNGNDMLVGAPGINSLKDMKGKKIGLEEGFVEHLLLLKGLEMNGMKDGDVIIVNTPTNETPQVLAWRGGRHRRMAAELRRGAQGAARFQANLQLRRRSGPDLRRSGRGSRKPRSPPRGLDEGRARMVPHSRLSARREQHG